MKLTPYPNRRLGWFKVCKHVFDHRERWWEIYGDLPTWQKEWTVFRSAGAVPASDRSATAIETRPALAEKADRHHIHWFQAAEQACLEATEDGTVLPADEAGKQCYIGRDGVTTYVAEGHYLVTCFRPVRAVGAHRTAEQVQALSVSRARRAAVRRTRRRASLLAENALSADQEGSA